MLEETLETTTTTTTKNKNIKKKTKKKGRWFDSQSQMKVFLTKIVKNML